MPDDPLSAPVLAPVPASGPAPGDSPEARAVAWLEQGGLRPTRQRLLLARALVGDGSHRHVTAESLHHHAAVEDGGVSLATVYNTLRAFRDAGLMREIVVDGARSTFDTNRHDHPHYYWEDEGRLTDAPSADLDIRRLPAAPDGAEVTAVDVVIRVRRK